MVAVNNFKAFAGGVGANVLTQPAYELLTTLIANGFQTGTAQSNELNKVWRQSTIMAAVLAQFIADETGQDAIDDGTTATLLANLKGGVQSVLERTSAAVGGTANAITATFTNPPSAWKPGVPYYVRAALVNTTTTPTYTPNNGVVTPKTIVKLNGQPLQPGDIAGAGHWLELIYDSTLDAVFLTNPALSAVAINFAGGAIGSIPYQTAANTTALLAAGTAGYILQANGLAAPSWVINPNFGMSQSWQTVSRAPGTNYVAPPRPIVLAVNYQVIGQISPVVFTVDGIAVPTGMISNNGGGTYTGGAMCFIPANATYSFNAPTGGSYLDAKEMR